MDSSQLGMLLGSPKHLPTLPKPSSKRKSYSVLHFLPIRNKDFSTFPANFESSTGKLFLTLSVLQCCLLSPRNMRRSAPSSGCMLICSHMQKFPKGLFMAFVQTGHMRKCSKTTELFRALMHNVQLSESRGLP